MNCKKCEDCYYGDTCPDASVCEGFEPITDEGEDTLILEHIEEDREEYRDAWNTYISEYND